MVVATSTEEIDRREVGRTTQASGRLTPICYYNDRQLN